MKKLIYLHVYILLTVVASKAQGDITLNSMSELYQNAYLNPANISPYDLSIGIPGLSNSVAIQLRGFSLGDINNNVNNGLFNVSNFYNTINASNIGLKAYSQSDLFHFRKSIGRYQIGIHSSVRSFSEAVVSKSFIGFITQGNALYAGQDLSFTGTNIHSTSYIETGISIAREFEKFSIGARIKMLNGLANLSTSNLDVHYHTGANSFDATTVSMSGSINSSGLPNPNGNDTINGVRNIDSLFSPNDLKPFENVGWAFDLGATYYATPRLKISASAIDIGFINWQNRPYNYTLNNISVVFPGFTYLQATDSTVRQKYLDSLNSLIKTSTSKNSYSTALPSRFIIGAEYDISLRDRVGLVFQLQYFMNNYFPSYTLSYSRKIGTNWRVHTNYSYYNTSFSNIGLGTSIKWGAFQIYAMQDDILFYLIPSNTRTIYVRFGCNLVWGEKKQRPRY